MPSGETILKFTDYPFAYSALFISLSSLGLEFYDEKALPYLVLAGFGATFLVITDPIGYIIKFILYQTRTQYGSLKNLKIGKEWNYIKSAFHAKAISIEIEKLVGIFYFLVILVIFIYALNNFDLFTERFEISLGDEFSCDLECIRDTVPSPLIAVAFLVAVMLIWNGIKTFNRIGIVATYLFSIDTPSIPRSSVESISRFIESGDWKTAEYWKGKIEHEEEKEEGFKQEREEKLNLHIVQIIREFRKFYDTARQENRKILLSYAFGQNPEKMRSLEQIFKEFPWYNSLVQHLFTKENKVYASFRKYLESESELVKNNERWKKEKLEKIETIIKNLELKIQQKTNEGISGEDGQWINLPLILHDLDNYITTNREELIPIRQVRGQANWEVRFFDSAGSSRPRNDVVALLHESDAQKLNVELANLARELRDSVNFSQTDYEIWKKTQDDLEIETREMLNAHAVNGRPVKGSCLYCRNTEFFSEFQIKVDEKKMKKFPNILKKDLLISKTKKETPKKTP